jgi:two-component system, chemotaxis family, chemotaxis protein CheY
MKILIVEDDPTSGRILHKMLQNQAICEVAVNGEEAIERFETAHQNQAPFDLILLDMILPEMKGPEVLHEIRNWETDYQIPKARQVKIIMSTGLEEVENGTGAWENLYDGCVYKPYQRETVIGKIRELGFDIDY